MIKTAILLPALFTAAVLCSSCSTTRIEIEPGNVPVQDKSAGGIEMTVHPLDTASLETRHGEVNNPFISPPSALKMNRILVVEVTAYNGSSPASDLFIQLNTVELQFGGKPHEPVNRFHLSNFWETRIEKDDDYRGWNAARVRGVVKKHVLPNTAQASRGEKIEGYIVFKGRLPSYGAASLYVPVFDAEGRFLHNFLFEFRY